MISKGSFLGICLFDLCVVAHCCELHVKFSSRRTSIVNLYALLFTSCLNISNISMNLYIISVRKHIFMQLNISWETASETDLLIRQNEEINGKY